MRLATVVAVSLLLPACGDDEGGVNADAAAGAADAHIADAAPPDADPLMPLTLEETGLYSDFAGEVVADGVLEYVPQYALWSDDASKRRWVLLPNGATIDTSNMDYWTLPVGTKLWKEFTSGSTRIETRLLQKTGDNQWYMMAYAWNEAQSEAVAVENGVTDALGTSHDIPSVEDCEKCHSRMPDVALGYSAIQLDHDGAGQTLDDLVTGGLLSDDPAGSAPYFAIPGDAGARAALGYMHANCGGCHHPQSSVDTVPIELRLEVGKLADVAATPAYVTAHDVDSVLTPLEPDLIKLIDPGSKETSVVWERMNRRDNKGMPPRGTEVVDTAGGLADVGVWIDSLSQ